MDPIAYWFTIGFVVGFLACFAIIALTIVYTSCIVSGRASDAETLIYDLERQEWLQQE